MRSASVVVFLPFAAGYLLSYLFRNVNALIAPNLALALGLTPGELGLVTAAYFLAFAVAQVPLGIALDHFGPRRVQSTLLLVAAAGSLLFAVADSAWVLTAGRVLIGAGVSGALMAGLKSIAQWFPRNRVAIANGVFIMFGGVGAYAAAGPTELIVQVTDWRTLFILLSGASLLVAALIFTVAPDAPAGARPTRLPEIIGGLRHVYRSRFFWTIAPASACAIGAAWSVQGLWAARWLADVEHLPRGDVVAHLSMMAVALCLGSVAAGFVLTKLNARGIRSSTVMAAAFALFLVVDLLVITRAPVPSYVLWTAFGAFASATVFGYTVLTEHFPQEFAGRATTALNLTQMIAAFALQSGMGAIVSAWPSDATGAYPAIAYQTAFTLPLVVQSLSLCWMLFALYSSSFGRIRGNTLRDQFG